MTHLHVMVTHKRREGFKKMIADALAGKIDFIITKSVSRFTRNTVDFLEQKMKPNEGEVPQYYVENSHPAIITMGEWNNVQAELTRRKSLGRAYSQLMSDRKQTIAEILKAAVRENAFTAQSHKAYQSDACYAFFGNFSLKPIDKDE